jgi:hypothetical protein
MNRLLCSVASCAVWIGMSSAGTFAVATQIVVARTETGFWAATNSTRNDGTQTCKLHYAGKKLLLMAGQPIGIRTHRQDGSRETSFDLDDDLWSVLRPELSGDQVMEETRKLIVARIQQFAPAVLDSHTSPIDFHLVLLSTDAPEPKMWIQTIRFSPKSLASPRVETHEYTPRPNSWIVWAGTTQSRRFTHSVDLKSMHRFLKDAAALGKRSNTHGFDPPFVVVGLDGTGLQYIEGDSIPCTATHPITAVP